jgi:hypothetical protein
VEFGFPKRGGPLNSTRAGLLNHQISKNSPILFWTKNSLLVYELRGLEGGIGIPKRGGPLNSTGAGLLTHQHLKIVQSCFGPKILCRCMNFEG